MEREGIKKHFEVFNAWLNGKEIEIRLTNNEWRDITNPEFWAINEYRIKSEKEFVPFTMDTIIPHLDRWIRLKEIDDELLCNRIIGYDLTGIYDQNSFISYGTLVEKYIFVDNDKPCGNEIN